MEQHIEHIAMHWVGNKSVDGDVVLSDRLLRKDGPLESLLGEYFLTPFTGGEYFHLYHDAGLEYNLVYSIVSCIFRQPESLLEHSQTLARHLFEQSAHPKIKGGEFYVAYLRGCTLDGETTDAVGLFKSENKDTFLKVQTQSGNFSLESDKGINIKKLDKGCLIYNREAENGYVAAVVDNTNRGMDAQYWIDDFLHLRQRKDEYANTQHVMTLAKNFVTRELPKEFEVTKADQIDLLNRSLEFFKENETFKMEDFTREVIAQPEVVEKFKEYRRTYEDEHDLSIDEEFVLSEDARKKQQRAYKRVIRLDRKIQIIIDGNRENVEQGEDEKGKFYKVYYRNEE